MATPIPDPVTPSALPSPPFVPMKGIPNFREVGGLPITGQPTKSLRRSYLFRCAEPTKATSEDIAKIKLLGITKIYDLRSRPEIEKHQVSSATTGNGAPYEWEGVERVYCPVFPEESWDPVSMAVRHKEYQREDAEGMVNAYRTIASEGVTAYTRIVKDMLASPKDGLIFHCTAGKDRTGVLAALLLLLAGVPDETIVQEYSLTNRGLGEWLQYLIQIVQRQTGASNEAAARMASARGESMAKFLEWVREQGGGQWYFKEKCGFSGDEVQRLKEILVVDEPPSVSVDF